MKIKEKISKYIQLLRKYNKLELQYNELLEYTKNKCFDKLLDKIGEPMTIKQLKKENRQLRTKIKELKLLIKN